MEKYLLPDTILKHDNRHDDVDELAGTLQDKAAMHDGSDMLSLSSSGTLDQRSKSPSSPQSAHSVGSPKPDPPLIKKLPTPAHSRNGSRQSNNTSEPSKFTPVAFSTKVPPSLQPLLNFVIWRVNHDHNPTAAFASFILLSNDAVTQSCASKFGIRVKRVEQLRETIKREDREFRDRMQVYTKEIATLKANLAAKESETVQPAPSGKITSTAVENTEVLNGTEESERKSDAEDDSDIDEVVLKRPPRALPVKQNITSSNSSNNGASGTPDVRSPGPINNVTPKVLDPNEFGRPPVGSMRGKPTVPRGPRNFSPRIAVKYSPGTPDQPIDPDLYFRPPPSRASVRGGRRLWLPT